MILAVGPMVAIVLLLCTRSQSDTVIHVNFPLVTTQNVKPTLALTGGRFREFRFQGI